MDCFRLYALKKRYRSEQCFGISVMLAVIGYLAAAMFNASVVSVAPVFWILLGTGAALNTINRRTDKQELAAQSASPKQQVPAAKTEAASEKPKTELLSIGSKIIAPPVSNANPQSPARREPTEAEMLGMLQTAMKKCERAELASKPTEPKPDDTAKEENKE